MPVTYDDAYQALTTFIQIHRGKMPPETVQLVTNICNKHALEMHGKAGILPVTPSKPSLTLAVKIIENTKWHNTYLLQNNGPSKDSSPANVNGFCVDDITDKDSMALRRIYVNADTGSVGTVIHEFLHFCTSTEFSAASTSHKLLYEGPTEYFTRQAQPSVDRSAHYPAEFATIRKLITDGNLTETKLAAAYFEGSSSAIKDTIGAITLTGGKYYSEVYDHVLKNTGHTL